MASADPCLEETRPPFSGVSRGTRIRTLKAKGKRKRVQSYWQFENNSGQTDGNTLHPMQRTLEGTRSSGESIERKQAAFGGLALKPLSAQCGTRPRKTHRRQMYDSKSMEKHSIVQAASANASPRINASGAVGLGLSHSMNHHPIPGMLSEDVIQSNEEARNASNNPESL